MGKKTKEFKAGDFIFAKVKGYPAWPARVRAVNGKKYFVHFYGTGETANLAANVLFDYVQNKESFLSKTFKRKDFNEGVKQIEYDFANNVPVEDVFGPLEPVVPADTSAIDTANETADTTMDTTFNETIANASTTSEGNAMAGMDDSDDGALVIDESAKKGKKSLATPKPKTVKHKEAETSTPVEEKKEEVVSRSGRKIRPKRFVDEEIEENAAMPTPIPKKRKATTPELADTLERVSKPSEPASEKEKNKQYQIVAQSEIESLKEPFPSGLKEIKCLNLSNAMKPTDIEKSFISSNNASATGNTFLSILSPVHMYKVPSTLLHLTLLAVNKYLHIPSSYNICLSPNNAEDNTQRKTLYEAYTSGKPLYLGSTVISHRKEVLDSEKFNEIIKCLSQSKFRVNMRAVSIQSKFKINPNEVIDLTDSPEKKQDHDAGNLSLENISKPSKASTNLINGPLLTENLVCLNKNHSIILTPPLDLDETAEPLHHSTPNCSPTLDNGLSITKRFNSSVASLAPITLKPVHFVDLTNSENKQVLNSVLKALPSNVSSNIQNNINEPLVDMVMPKVSQGIDNLSHDMKNYCSESKVILQIDKNANYTNKNNSKSDSDGYNSSDFEFISEAEAKIMNTRILSPVEANKSVKRVKFAPPIRDNAKKIVKTASTIKSQGHSLTSKLSITSKPAIVPVFKGKNKKKKSFNAPLKGTTKIKDCPSGATKPLYALNAEVKIPNSSAARDSGTKGSTPFQNREVLLLENTTSDQCSKNMMQRTTSIDNRIFNIEKFSPPYDFNISTSATIPSNNSETTSQTLSSHNKMTNFGINNLHLIQNDSNFPTESNNYAAVEMNITSKESQLQYNNIPQTYQQSFINSIQPRFKKSIQAAGSLISSTMNILNDEELISQSSSVATLSPSQSQDMTYFQRSMSTCSVNSLSKKMYKNLDNKSGECEYFDGYGNPVFRSQTAYSGNLISTSQLTDFNNMCAPSTGQVAITGTYGSIDPPNCQSSTGLTDVSQSQRRKRKRYHNENCILSRRRYGTIPQHDAYFNLFYNRVEVTPRPSMMYYECKNTKPIHMSVDLETRMKYEERNNPPSSPDEKESQDNILVCKLPDNRWVGIRLFASRPAAFKDAAARLSWETAQAKNSIQLKLELESGQTKPESIASQLLLDLNLSDEEKANLNKEKEIEERKSRVQFLKAEMKLLDLDAKIKTCLNLTKADTEQCLKLLDELDALEVRPLMLLKHPAALETVKRMRSYVGNAPSWRLSEADALAFQARALRIRQRADALYTKYKALYDVPAGIKFWEFFSERVLQFKRITAELTANQLLEMVHEPPELSKPRAYTNQAAIDEANKEGEEKMKKSSPGKKNKTAETTPTKTPQKGRPGRKPKEPETVPEKPSENDETSKDEEPPKKVSNKSDKSKKDEDNSKSSNDRTKPVNENSIGEESSEPVAENNLPEEAPKETEASEKSTESPNETDKPEQMEKKVEESPRKITLKRKRESNQESPHKKKVDAKNKVESSQTNEESNKKNTSNEDKNEICEDKDRHSQNDDKSTKERNDTNKDVDQGKKDQDENIKGKEKTKKGKNESSKGKNETSKGKNESNKGKDKANKSNEESNEDKEEASKDREEASQGKDETNKDEDETNNDEDKTVR